MDPSVGIPQLVYRVKCPEWKHDLAPLVSDLEPGRPRAGERFGRQYAVWRGEQVSPPAHLLWPHLARAVPTLATPVTYYYLLSRRSTRASS